MLRLSKLILIVVIFGLMTGCAKRYIPVITMAEVESDAMLTGSLGRTVCQVAKQEHKETGQWPDALRLAHLSGLSTHNYFYDKDYAVYILDKPYYPIPAQMDSTQTFAFYGYHHESDNSYYTYCRWYYQYGPGDMELSSSEGDGASVHGSKLNAEQMLIEFLLEAREANSALNFNEIVNKHALSISETSPNPTAKQILFEFTYDLLGDYYNDVVNLDSDSEAFFEKFDKYSLRLGEFIFRQDWTQR